MNDKPRSLPHVLKFSFDVFRRLNFLLANHPIVILISLFSDALRFFLDRMCLVRLLLGETFLFKSVTGDAILGTEEGCGDGLFTCLEFWTVFCLTDLLTCLPIDSTICHFYLSDNTTFSISFYVVAGLFKAIAMPLLVAVLITSALTPIRALWEGPSFPPGGRWFRHCSDSSAVVKSGIVVSKFSIFL